MRDPAARDRRRELLARRYRRDPSEANKRALIADLAALRRASPSLRDGAVRWLAATPDVVVFIREHVEECLLVAAARSDYDGVRVPLDLLPVPWADARPIDLGLQGASAEESRDALVLSGRGPGVQAWRLPGIPDPARNGWRGR